MNIADSEKDGENSAGQFGIGRLVGGYFCKKLTFKTSYKGEDCASEIIFDIDKIKYQKCLKNRVKVFYISFERKIPDDYFAPVYRTLDELFHAIDNEIKNQTNNIKLTENDLKYIINQTYKKIIK